MVKFIVELKVEDNEEEENEWIPWSYGDDRHKRLSGNIKRHRPEPIMGNGKKRYPQKRCKVCSAHKLRKDTRYICGFCKVPLHRGSCFERYHTRKRY